MASSSVSFRISRSAEDLATTIHAVSQRLVQLEQRLEALELQLTNQDRPDPQEITRLENVDRLLDDCRALLELDAAPVAQPSPPPITAPPLVEASEPAEEEGSAFTDARHDDAGDELLAA
ncbi:MAG: hypothetical protein ACK531_11530 [Cyanobacteriota bacterium]|jgi:uncharacterized membrane protein YccC